jgi:hypothetical protein
VKDFTCPECGVTYALHWWATDGSLLCRTCADTRAGRCRWPGHPDHDNPCAYAQEEPGGPTWPTTTTGTTNSAPGLRGSTATARTP